jgi:hypothetical protein
VYERSFVTLEFRGGINVLCHLGVPEGIHVLCHVVVPGIMNVRCHLTTELRRVHVHSSLLVVTSNQNSSNKKKNRLNIYLKPGMSHYIPCLIAE